MRCLRSLLVVVLALVVASSVCAYAQDNRDLSVKDIIFKPQGDGSVAVETVLEIKQLGSYGFNITIEHYRNGQLIGTIRNQQVTETASGCAGVADACPGGAICANSCTIGDPLRWGYTGLCETSGCCFGTSGEECEYFCYCMGDIPLVGLVPSLVAGDSVRATITVDPGTVDSIAVNNIRTETY